MPPTFVDCPSCGFECKADDDQGDQPIVCPKCKKSFAVDIRDNYDVDVPPPPRPSRAPASPPPRSARPLREDTEDSPAKETQGKSWLEAWPQD